MTAVCGGLDQKVHWLDFESGGQRVLGSHNGAVRCVEYSQKLNLAVSASWDSTCQAFDARSDECIARLQLPGKALAMTLGGEWRLTVASNATSLSVFDLRQLDHGPIESRESPIKHQIRALASFPDNKSFVVSTIEGRCAVECFADSPNHRKNFAFKCHRVKSKESETVYPVNALAFNSVYGTFVSGGSDGHVNVWDHVNRKNLTRFHQYPTSISSLAFSSDSALLAIAVSYSFEDGDKKHPKDEISIRKVSDTDVKPKAK
jgi:cell cycle arrest protein BUB3